LNSTKIIATLGLVTLSALMSCSTVTKSATGPSRSTASSNSVTVKTDEGVEVSVPVSEFQRALNEKSYCDPACDNKHYCDNGTCKSIGD
jgi:hypothetical protein